MHFSTSTISLFAALFLNGATANPLPSPEAPQIAGPMKCYNYEYRDVTSVPEDEPWRFVSGSEMKGCGSGCEIGNEVSYEVTVEVSVGLGLGLDFKGASGGLNAAVSYGITKGEANSQTIGCPDGAVCALMAQNHMMRVKGTRYSKGPDMLCKKRAGEPYSILLPQVVTGSNGSKTAKVLYAGCYLKKPEKAVDGYSYPDCPK